MQSPDWVQFAVGLLLGISAAPHCIVMCSGVATAISVPSMPRTNSREALARALVSNCGRLASYAVAGGIVGGIGVAAFSWLDATLANITLRWLAAVLLSVVGLSIVGIMPALIVKYPRTLMRWLVARGGCNRYGGNSYTSLFVAGTVWGFLPCAMAYSALFYATVSGSVANGVLTMMGFGFATLFPMILPALSLPFLANYSGKASFKVGFGVALVLIGLAGTIDAVRDFGVWCRSA